MTTVYEDIIGGQRNKSPGSMINKIGQENESSTVLENFS